MTLKFKSIELHNWRQFRSVEINAHPRLTIITGSNGAGKSTILNLFSQHFGFSRPMVATPKLGKDGRVVYDLGYYSQKTLWDELADDDSSSILTQNVEPPEDRSYQPLFPPGAFVQIGTVSYTDGRVAPLGYHEQAVTVYGISIQNQAEVKGVQLSSHRAVVAYQQVQALPFQTLEVKQTYQLLLSEANARLSGGHSQYSSFYRMKEALIAMAAFGEGNSHLEANADLLKAFNGFANILKKVLPKEIGFQKITIRLPEVILKTHSGEFVVDASSGGVSAIIEMAWQLYLYSLTSEEFVVTIDEPENHLHPSMQRSLMPNLLDAFPKVQFIVATHSPFIVSAVEDSAVYALRYTGRTGREGLPTRGPRRVVSTQLDQVRKAGTASEILREVLGVDVTIPDWAQSKLDAIVEKYGSSDVDKESLKELRSELANAGFSEFYPEALAKLVKDK